MLAGVSVALSAALVAGHNGHTAASTFNSPVPNSFFGMHIHRTSNYPTVPIGALGKGSCVDWEYVEPSRGTYNWSTLDGYVNAAAANGVDIFYSNGGVPSWAITDHSSCVPSGCGGPQFCAKIPDSIADWQNFYTALVTRYKGRIKYYELWNEPYMTYGNGIGLSPSDAVVLTTAAYNIIRANDPTAQIITPSMDGQYPSYAASYFAAGGPTAVDIASLHAYPDPFNSSADRPETISLGHYLYPKALQSVISQYLPGKPLWDTEGSWNRTGRGNFTTPDQQAAFIARWYILHWSNGISRSYWYAWDDSEYGTLLPSILGSSVPATAFRELQKWMVGATMRSPCTVASDGVTWTCGLARPGGYRALIIWNTQGKRPYTPPHGYVKYRDLSGNSLLITGEITTDIKPLMLEK